MMSLFLRLSLRGACEAAHFNYMARDTVSGPGTAFCYRKRIAFLLIQCVVFGSVPSGNGLCLSLPSLS
ncbi:uncharacterized protein PHALS_14961 [Plasmopara halstedii]|uniref:Uncharacterized protein n=1 Tax=Plasmopara halstedii TaxID=4781 RepID=A0A0P1B1E2_PLAHL|nr:uncharacterized protein PHALS_14961 [Plasmopara halstedii]CEG47082.1 hypothetical protein PHALS_14961 [Plasmopara halstedii]|eukprot:XP_024583451.1 hypothetical protein PHALS_14961 [Plasmopara halstedii]